MSIDPASAAASLAIPALQAAATILILEYQKDLYDDIADERIALINAAVNKFTASIDAQIAAGAFTDAFGTKPKVVLYEPVDTKALGIDTAEDALAGIPASQRYMNAANRIMEQESITRMLGMDARYLCDMELASCTLNQLLKGELPVGDVIEIIKDNAEKAALHGRVGNTHSMTMRDLGISRLRSQLAGANLLDAQIDRINRVAPRAEMVSLREFQQTPAQRLALAASEAQLIQQSLQNSANIDAAGNPDDYAELQAKLQEYTLVLGTESQRGNMINQFVPNYAALLAPAIDSISGALLGSGGDPMNAYTGSETTRYGNDIAATK